MVLHPGYPRLLDVSFQGFLIWPLHLNRSMLSPRMSRTSYFCLPRFPSINKYIYSNAYDEKTFNKHTKIMTCRELRRAGSFTHFAFPFFWCTCKTLIYSFFIILKLPNTMHVKQFPWSVWIKSISYSIKSKYQFEDAGYFYYTNFINHRKYHIARFGPKDNLKNM